MGITGLTLVGGSKVPIIESFSTQDKTGKVTASKLPSVPPAGFVKPAVVPPPVKPAVAKAPVPPAKSGGSGGCFGFFGGGSGGAKKTEGAPLIKKKEDIEIVEVKEKKILMYWIL